MLTSGQPLADRYRLDRRIAVGGMGEVWQAVDVRLDRTVAVKVLKPELCGDAEFLHRFRTEARTTASLNHPGIAAVHDYGETAAVPDGPEDTAYLVMELVEGEPLAAILAREGRITVEHTLDMLEQAGSALHAAHERGLVHRDVKPGNILVTQSGTIKLTDFGIAKAADAAPVTRSGMVMGTAHYIAPEQALGGDATPSSDIYSLAVVGYECLKGHRPFLSDNAVTVAMMHIREVAPPLPPDVPPGARALIDATMTKDPRLRYSGGGEFAAAVSAVRAGRPLPAPAALTVPQHMRVAAPGQEGTVQTPPGQAGHRTGVHQVPQAGPQAGTSAPPQHGHPTGGSAPAPGPGHPAPSGQTFPPGGIPPQQPPPAPMAQQPAPQPHAAQPHSPQGQATGDGRRGPGLWIVLGLAVLVVIVVVVSVGLALARTWSAGSGSPGPTRGEDLAVVAHGGRADTAGDVRLLGSASQPGPKSATFRHPGTRPRAQAHAARRVERSVTTADRRRPPRTATARLAPDRAQSPLAGNEVGGTAHRALVRRTSAVTGPRVGTTGRPWTRIGTTQR